MKKGVLIFLFLLMMFSLYSSEVPGTASWDEHGHLVFKSDDGNFMMRLDTRFYINASLFLDDPQDVLSNQSNLRKARFAIKSTLWKYWNFEWDIDVAEGDHVEVKDMWTSYSGFRGSHIKFGNFKQPLGLEELTSSRYLVFPERALPILAFETDRQFGLEYSRWGNMGLLPYNLRTSIFTQSLSNESKDDYQKTEHETGGGGALRFVMAPEINKDILLHLGISEVYEMPFDESNEMRFKCEAETKNGDIEWFDTGDIKEVDHSIKLGLEGVLQYKNWHFQGEYINTRVIRQENSQENDVELFGGYGYISWLITGERRAWNINEGEFGQIIPEKKGGAWELAARYSHIFLSDEDAGIMGGAGNLYTIGLNWYANPNVKIQTAFTMADLNANANCDGEVSFDQDYDDGYDFNYLQFMTVFFF